MSPVRAAALLAVLAFAASPAAADKVHVVQPGETLWQIAAVVAGDPHRWPELYRANRDQIQDPSRLYPGQRLAIPDFSNTRPPSASRATSPPREPGH